MTSKGTAMCPVSGASFDYEAEIDEAKMTVDKDGNVKKDVQWKTEGDE